MEFRLLEYFLAVAREQSITAAAEALHISQPALSTQLKGLEDELGKKLLIRGVKGSRKVVLTEEGMILRKRAEEMLSLMRRTEEEISGADDTIAGNVFIGAGETEIVRLFAKVANILQKNILILNTTSRVETLSMSLNISIRALLTLDFCFPPSTRIHMRRSRCRLRTAGEY